MYMYMYMYICNYTYVCIICIYIYIYIHTFSHFLPLALRSTDFFAKARAFCFRRELCALPELLRIGHAGPFKTHSP